MSLLAAGIGVLHHRGGDPVTCVLEGHALDPVAGHDGPRRIVVEDGVIMAIEPGTANELLLLPGFVDPHVHLRTPGREDEETIASGTLAAASGGYCAILAMPNTDPVVDNAAVLGSLVEQALADAVVPTGFLAAITKGQRGEELTEMAELAAHGAAGFTDDGKPVVSAGLLRRALQYCGVTGLRLALHEEDPTLTHGGHMREGAVSAELGIGGWPGIGESVMVERDLTLAAYEDRPLHLQHLSARQSVAAVRRARAAGVDVTCEASPHHLCLTDAAIRSLDTNLKMNPPLGTEDDRQALLAGVLDGTIDCIATDHAPHARHEKDVPFEEAPFGVLGLETAFAALHTFLVEPGALPLALLVERLTAGPARAFALPRPQIAVGAPLNLAVVDRRERWTVDGSTLHSLSANSWLLGSTLTGRVRETYAAGARVYAV